MNTLNTTGYLFLMLHVRLHNLSQIKSKVALYTCYGSGPNFLSSSSQCETSVMRVRLEGRQKPITNTH